MRVVPQAAGASAHDADQVARQAGIMAGTAVQVVEGRLDTAVAACTDFEHSPFTPAGPCAVSFLMCFACPNALATGRHLPRIIYLIATHTTKAERAGLRAQLTDGDRELIDSMLDRRLDS